MMETPKAGWTQTTDVVKWAEDFSIFLSREKTNAERCLHDCERLLNDPNVTDSDSLRDGVRDLMSKTEDNFGTLLHLERVINMKNHGDISQQHRTTPSMKIQQPQNSSSKTVAGSAPVQFTQTGRFKQQRIHGGGDFLKRDSKNNDGSTDEHFDDQFKDDFFFDESNHEEETPTDETLDDFDDDSGFPEAAYKNRPSSGEKVSMLAKSMPMNVPDMRKFGMDHSSPEVDEDTQDIPTKINELARSLYVDAIGELPSPRLVE